MAKRNEVLAGLVVLVSLLVLGAGLLMLVGGSSLFADTRTVIVQFPDAGGGRAGDPVAVAGKRVGKVLDSRFAPMTLAAEEGEEQEIGGENGRERVGVELELEIEGHVEIPIDSTIRVVESLTGSRVVSVTPGFDRDVRDGEKLRGERGKGFADFAGLAVDLQKPIAEVAEAARLLLTDVRRLVRDIDEGVDAEGLREIVTRVGSTTVALERLVARVDGTVDRLEPELSGAIESIRRAAESADRLIVATEPKLADVLTELERLSRSAGDLVAGEDSPVGRTVVKVGAAADTLRETLGGFDEAGKGASDLVTRIRPKVTSILESLSVTGTNLRAASEDLRAHPWKLLNAPDVEDQRVQELFNAARNFSDGAESIRRAAQELHAALERGAPVAEVEALVGKLTHRHEAYERAEELLWRALREE